MLRPLSPTTRVRLYLAAASLFALTIARADEKTAAASFRQKVEPLLSKYCADCHYNGIGKGNVSFDEFASDADLLAHGDLWAKALRNVRAGLMPPKEEGDDNDRPKAEEIETLARWIKFEALGIDPANPDPGRVTVRRLNRVEYRNTIRDLLGIDFNSEAEFPPDDTGGGFDNNGDVLTISPLLLEKYLGAAETIADKGVPKISRVIRERVAGPRDFKTEDGRSAEQWTVKRAVKLRKTFTVDQAETYRVAVELQARGSFDFDPNRCKIICRIDGEEKYAPEIVWAEGKAHKQSFELKWAAGEHVVEFEIVPLPPVDTPENPRAEFVAAQARAAAAEAAKEGAAGPEVAAPASLKRPSVAASTSARLDVRITNVTVSGPLDKKFWVTPEAYAKFFPGGLPPEEPAARDRYATEIVRKFATRAFRRPVEEAKIQQLAAIAKATYTQPGKSFEDGIARAVMATLASPRFLFRVEDPVRGTEKQAVAPVDEFALASRLSYFLWSTMPDEELFKVAGRGELRAQLQAQVTRMLHDPKAQAFVKDFTGQWLQARDIEFVPINARAVLGIRGFGRAGAANAPRIDFDSQIRKAMRTETEMYFDYVVREDRSLLELIDSDYTFLNERLASHYGVDGVSGDAMRKVTLPPGSPRGGLLTQGTILAVTSNPTRTSPVKRGVFILDNVLGTPPPPPPPNVPDIEEAKKELNSDREPKLSELLAIHRSAKLCSSCHSRMDPLGLALENFNAMGMWRDTEAKQPIEPAGQLVTGEKFATVRELKHILATARQADFYRCFTEKLLTYALGRGLEPRDTQTVDLIVERLEREHGKASAALFGVIESAPFQKQRTSAAARPLALRENKP